MATRSNGRDIYAPCGSPVDPTDPINAKILVFNFGELMKTYAMGALAGFSTGLAGSFVVLRDPKFRSQGKLKIGMKVCAGLAYATYFGFSFARQRGVINLVDEYRSNAFWRYVLTRHSNTAVRLYLEENINETASSVVHMAYNMRTVLFGAPILAVFSSKFRAFVQGPDKKKIIVRLGFLCFMYVYPILIYANYINDSKAKDYELGIRTTRNKKNNYDDTSDDGKYF